MNEPTADGSPTDCAEDNRASASAESEFESASKRHRAQDGISSNGAESATSATTSGNLPVVGHASVAGADGAAAQATAARSDRWRVDKAAVQAAVEAAFSEFHTEDEGIVFLLAKGVMKSVPALRAVQFTDLLNSSGEEWEARRARLKRLVDLTGDTTHPGNPGWQSFNDFLKVAPGWEHKDAYMFHVARNVSLAHRVHHSGLCYIHAPAVVQRYLVSLHQKDVGMIDMTKLLRETFTAKELEKHIFEDEGGSSFQMLKRILQPGSKFVTDGTHEDNLKTYGPGLVSGFAVDPDFHAGHASYDGELKGKVVGHHAMALIGVRRDPSSGQLWYLLQNWWPQAQFVEVSREYLISSEAKVSFVITPQLKIPDDFSTQSQLFAENENVDKPEQMMSEDPACPVPGD
eukprot:CAMPEP_0174828866 /NCGR_PEP_ID=MMETSP1114-20130205/1577_1 /TAXON_ID=312471 /ORGANISM="Neobodo designis, Strain CCAP 1951/1" /LENGTH=402 /DNA_ID=CAMNT_0016062593 /DNA_START=67 /DNA_END=1275 /DNA_ORIENTATION=-